MIKHIFSVVCNGTSIDRETNSLSLFNVLEQLTVYTDSTDPLRIPIHFEIISLWTRQALDVPCRGNMRVTFCRPDGQQRKQAEIALDLSRATNHRSKLISDGIELTGPGRYQFIIELQTEDNSVWKEVAKLPIIVSYQPGPPA